MAALKPDDVVLGGGNAKKLKGLPPGTRLGTTPTPSSAAFVCGRTVSVGQKRLPGAKMAHPGVPERTSLET